MGFFDRNRKDKGKNEISTRRKDSWEELNTLPDSVGRAAKKGAEHILNEIAMREK